MYSAKRAMQVVATASLCLAINLESQGRLYKYENLETEPAPTGVSDLDWDIFSVTNRIRTDPTYFISYLEERLPYFDEDNILWLPGEYGLITQEGAAAVEEGIEFLQT